MINPFIKLTGTDGYGNERMLHLNVNQICGYYIDTRGHNTKIVSGAEIFCAIETPEEISAMIQKYYDNLMLSEYAKHGVQRDSMDTIIRADLAFDLAGSMLKEFKERVSDV